MIRVLVVDDEDLTAAAHAEYVRRIPGFDVAGIASTAAAAIAALADATIDLVLLDMNLPDGHGIEVARRLRASGNRVDIIAITAVREIEVVRGALSLGIVQYLVKPFGFATFSEKLAGYANWRSQLDASTHSTTQSQIDAMLATLSTPTLVSLPKGLAAATLAAVSAFVRSADAAVSAVEVAEALRLSRVTARRYLEHLADTGVVTRGSRYGTPGRPELEYNWSR
ncbi:response regulator [Glaciihabitans arcticus]|uniref:Transcriptional regulatory protein n=1 Tax=Glaciihabitans arcticus TaxID=2668039 RepID=A0A4Q9GW48_9MICO|nr:response regulator [Glaciihabitans arcticus]TBN56430.1 response regulator [Glaciihabitans arcticus]